MDQTALLLNSITDAGPTARGRVVVSGSHGGVYPAAIASQAGVHAVILNDAGIGYEQAGVAGLHALDRCGMAAAAVGCQSAEIGSAEDMLRSGTISFANDTALAAGIRVGMTVPDAVGCLVGVAAALSQMAAVAEARWEQQVPGCTERVLCMDSASLVRAEDVDRIIITGSHGGLIGGDPVRALKTTAKLAVFNDAGGGKNAIGLSRLPALDARGVAAVTVSHDSCRIGEAASALKTGVISSANNRAQQLGATIGARLADFLAVI